MYQRLERTTGGRTRMGVTVALVALMAAAGTGSAALAGPSSAPATKAAALERRRCVPTRTTKCPRPAGKAVKPRPKVKLPTGGPRGPVDPPDTPAYEYLAAGGTGCQTLLKTINAEWGEPSRPDDPGVEPRLTYLYRAAAEACLLRWAEAKADFDRFQDLKSPPFGATCESEVPFVRYCERCHQLVLKWLTGQLAAYRRDPTYAPVFVADSATAPSPCAPRTTTVVSR